MARRKQSESTVTFLNEPPSGEKIMEHLLSIYLMSKGFEVKGIEVTPSKTGKKEITAILDGVRYHAVEGEEAICEKI